MKNNVVEFSSEIATIVAEGKAAIARGDSSVATAKQLAELLDIADAPEGGHIKKDKGLYRGARLALTNILVDWKTSGREHLAADLMQRSWAVKDILEEIYRKSEPAAKIAGAEDVEQADAAA